MASLSNFLPQIGPRGVPSTSAQNIDIIVTAGETLAAGNCVYLASPKDITKTAGRFYKCDSGASLSSSLSSMVGFATTAITTGATGSIRISGIVIGLSSLTVGAAYFVSTTGAITAVTIGLTNSRLIGFAVSSTELLINTTGYQTAITGLGGLYGYILGGYTGGIILTTDKITYSTDTTAAATGSSLALGKYQAQGVSEGSTKGYVIGGFTGAFILVANAESLTFSTGTVAARTTANATRVVGSLAGVSERSTKGYIAGGSTGTYVTTADKITFSSDSTAASTSANLSQGRGDNIGITEGTSKGYFAGGNTNNLAPVIVDTGDKLVYSTDTTTACTTAKLGAPRCNVAGISDGLSKGYYLGGSTGTTVASTDKLTFSTDTTASQTTANLSQARGWAGNVSEGMTKGYVCGGFTGAKVKISDKTVYSTDITIAATTADLTIEKYGQASISDIGL